MIINGHSRSNAKFFTQHLLNAEQNERVEVKEIRGFVADNVPDAFKEIEIIGSATRAKNSFYHSNINPDEGEKLTPEQWAQTIDTLEQKLGLEGQPRFVIAHEKKDREHIHVVWSRIDPDTMTAIPMDNNYLAHTETARELERMFGHEPTPVPPHPERDRFKDWETFRAQESGIDPKAMKAEITALYHASDSAAAFESALEHSGYTLCRGDKQGVLCIVDSAGDSHALLRRIAGLKAAELRAFMADIDPQALPSVKEATELVKAQPEDGGGGQGAVTSGQHYEEPHQWVNPKLAVLEKFAHDHPALAPPDTYAVVGSAEEFASLSAAILHARAGELSLSSDTGQHAWDTLRARTIDAPEVPIKGEDKSSDFWQEWVSRLPERELEKDEPELER